jgi:hypothetical protein
MLLAAMLIGNKIHHLERTVVMRRTCGLAAVLGVVLLAGYLGGSSAEGGDQADFRPAFLSLCDGACKALHEQVLLERPERQFYRDSYAVRGLAVAYDLTGKPEYLRACKEWSDRMIEYQNDMIPKGAYYMQYGRRPKKNTGHWYVADSSSIALGILATAVRCEDPSEKAKYMDSIKAFTKLVRENFLRPSGGVTDGYWPSSNDEWWCSTGIFGSLAFCLYKETGDEDYLKIGLGTIDWLNRQDLLTVAEKDKDFPTQEIKPTVMMYSLEAYSAGLPHLEAGSPRQKAAIAQLAAAHRWMLGNMEGKSEAAYLSQWGSKFGGLPFHLYVYAGQMPGNDNLTAAGDGLLRRLGVILDKAPPSAQLTSFALMSYAERIGPGNMYRASKRPMK